MMPNSTAKTKQEALTMAVCGLHITKNCDCLLSQNNPPVMTWFTWFSLQDRAELWGELKLKCPTCGAKW